MLIDMYCETVEEGTKSKYVSFTSLTTVYHLTIIKPRSAGRRWLRNIPHGHSLHSSVFQRLVAC